MLFEKREEIFSSKIHIKFVFQTIEIRDFYYWCFFQKINERVKKIANRKLMNQESSVTL